MPRVNLLPWRESDRKRRRQEFLLSIGAAVASAALVTLIGRFEMNGAIAHQDARNKELEKEISKLDDQIKEIEGLERQKQALIARMQIIETLQRSRPEIVHVFDELVHVLPEGVYLTYLKQSGSRIEMRGIAQSSTRVSTFMRNIDSSEWLADPSLQIVETKARDAGHGSTFTLFATQRKQVPDEDAAAGAKKKKVAAK